MVRWTKLKSLQTYGTFKMTFSRLFVSVAALSLASVAVASDAVQFRVSSKNDVSPPLRELVERGPSPDSVSYPGLYVVPNIFLKSGSSFNPVEGTSPLVQRTQSPQLAPPVSLAFDGISSALASSFVLPPDTNGDVGAGRYVQWVNSHLAIFDSATGARLSGPTPGNSLFNGFGGPCQTRNDGDPIVIFDDAAQRWVLSQFVSGGGSATVPLRQCVAVSTTSDPLGTYNRYEFTWPFIGTLPIFGDYPHIGIWREAGGKQNAYTMVLHDFTGSGATSVFRGASFVAMERDKMLAGLPAGMVRFGGLNSEFGAQPVHIEGNDQAPSGACPVFVHFNQSNQYKFNDMCLNWTTPALSSLSSTQLINARTPFTLLGTDVSQPGTTAALDTFPLNVMYRAVGRQFSDAAPLDMAITITHSVEVGTTASQGAVKWVLFNARSGIEGGTYGFEDVGTPALTNRRIIDEGTFAPDAASRWMGAVAIDKGGNLGIGYSVASTTLNPKLRTTGREYSDPAGQLQTEVDCSPAVTGSQTSTSNRWGDYASMSVDTDDCSFWFTSEYYSSTSAASWNTRVCKFAFPSCTAPNFGIGVNKSRLQICKTDQGPVGSFPLVPFSKKLEVEFGAFNGFTGPGTLSSTGLPAALNLSGTATIPGKLNFNFDNTTVAEGEYTGSLTLTSGAQTRSTAFSVGISDAASAAPVLGTPANGAVDQKVNPVLTWSVGSGSAPLEYKLEIATDAAFATIISSVTLPASTTSFTPAGLLAATQYHWRVRGINYCGEGLVAAARTFTTTATPGACPAGTSRVTIFQDDFQAGVNNWTTASNGTGTVWSQGTPAAGTGMTATVWQVPNYGPASGTPTSDQRLITPSIAIPAGAQNVTMSFDTYHSFELDSTPTGCWDGGSVEMRVGAVDTYLTADRVYTNPYNGVLSDGAPLAGRRVWCRIPSPTPARTVIDADGFAGQSVKVVFRVTADTNTAAAAPNGMVIDNFKFEYCQ